MKLQYIVLGIFAIIVIIAVLILAGILPGIREESELGTDKLIMWGTYPKELFKEIISEAKDKNLKLEYVEKSPRAYESDLINALASGQGPDIWLLSQDLILKHKDKIAHIKTALTAREFKDIFIDEGDLLLDKEGIIGLPFIIDPMVLYWNRDLFQAAGIASPPKTWDEFIAISQKLTLKDSDGNIIQSGAGLGVFENIKHSKDIISLLILQTGNPIINPHSLQVTLGETEGLALNPAESAVRFFTEFSNSQKISYSWHQAMLQSDQAFLTGKLAMYFGYASEYNTLRERNPHLNFDVAEVPQIKDGKVQATFAKMQSLVISKQSNYPQASWKIVKILTEEDIYQKFCDNIFMPPAQRALLLKQPEDPALAVFYKSAVKSRAWLEPNPEMVSNIFQNMIESVNTGRQSVHEAVKDAEAQLGALMKNSF